MKLIYRASAAASWLAMCEHVEGEWCRAFFSRNGAQLSADRFTILPGFSKKLPRHDGPTTDIASILPPFPITTFDSR